MASKRTSARSKNNASKNKRAFGADEGNTNNEILDARGSPAINTIEDFINHGGHNRDESEIQTSSENVQKNQESEKPDFTFVEAISIKEGQNKIEIKLFSTKFRAFQLRIFMNDTEIRNTTFTGARQAMSYWSLLKGIVR